MPHKDEWSDAVSQSCITRRPNLWLQELSCLCDATWSQQAEAQKHVWVFPTVHIHLTVVCYKSSTFTSWPLILPVFCFLLRTDYMNRSDYCFLQIALDFGLPCCSFSIPILFPMLPILVMSGIAFWIEIIPCNFIVMYSSSWSFVLCVKSPLIQKFRA